MKELETIEKPLVYRLTDQWVPKILVLGILILWIWLFTLFTEEDYLMGIIAPVLMPAFAYFGMKNGISFVFKSPLLNESGRKFVVAFFWFGGFFPLLGLPIILFHEIREDINELFTVLLLFVVCFALCLAASHSWESIFKVKPLENHKK